MRLTNIDIKYKIYDTIEQTIFVILTHRLRLATRGAAVVLLFLFKRRSFLINSCFVHVCVENCWFVFNMLLPVYNNLMYPHPSLAPTLRAPRRRRWQHATNRQRARNRQQQHRRVYTYIHTTCIYLYIHIDTFIYSNI